MNISCFTLFLDAWRCFSPLLTVEQQGTRNGIEVALSVAASVDVNKVIKKNDTPDWLVPVTMQLCRLITPTTWAKIISINYRTTWSIWSLASSSTIRCSSESRRMMVVVMMVEVVVGVTRAGSLHSPPTRQGHSTGDSGRREGSMEGLPHHGLP